MQTLKTMLLVVTLSLLFTFCADNESQNTSVQKFPNTELLGEWVAVSANESLKGKDSKINSINLVNDSIAKVQLIDATGERILKGTWQNGFEKKSDNSGLVFKSDIKITYYPNKQNKNILLLKLSQENNNLIMSGNQLEFKKE